MVVVDDHALVAETLELALTRQGLPAAHVEVPAGPTPVDTVVAAVLREDPGVVVLDLDLGAWGDGSTLIAPVVAAGARVVALSDDHGPDDLARARACGASTVLSKTGSLAAVLETVRSLLAAGPEGAAPSR